MLLVHFAFLTKMIGNKINKWFAGEVRVTSFCLLLSFSLLLLFSLLLFFCECHLIENKKNKWAASEVALDVTIAANRFLIFWAECRRG